MKSQKYYNADGERTYWRHSPDCIAFEATYGVNPERREDWIAATNLHNKYIERAEEVVRFAQNAKDDIANRIEASIQCVYAFEHGKCDIEKSCKFRFCPRCFKYAVYQKIVALESEMYLEFPGKAYVTSIKFSDRDNSRVRKDARNKITIMRRYGVEEVFRFQIPTVDQETVNLRYVIRPIKQEREWNEIPGWEIIEKDNSDIFLLGMSYPIGLLSLSVHNIYETLLRLKYWNFYAPPVNMDLNRLYRHSRSLRHENVVEGGLQG